VSYLEVTLAEGVYKPYVVYRRHGRRGTDAGGGEAEGRVAENETRE